jgi:hypothetical protein
MRSNSKRPNFIGRWLAAVLLIAATPLHADSASAPDAIDLRFEEFYVAPAGPRGLTMTPKLKELDSRRVRIAGYMARQEEPVPGVFILAPYPVNIAEVADGPADDLPAAHVFVRAPSTDLVALPRPGLVTLVGTLRVGRATEVDGRVSWVRLLLDHDYQGRSR